MVGESSERKEGGVPHPLEDVMLKNPVLGHFLIAIFEDSVDIVDGQRSTSWADQKGNDADADGLQHLMKMMGAMGDSGTDGGTEGDKADLASLMQLLGGGGHAGGGTDNPSDAAGSDPNLAALLAGLEQQAKGQ